ncbi:MAG TPA: WecB/TagA/CpsF family glycosyltransferase [Ignavibacteria bacterium]|mgnify:CR=1 FL=1|nr:WecB/TagA/CpsF family glycosyltransferase [Ignavibacteria bacterium]
MSSKNPGTVNIFGVDINRLSETEFLDIIKNSIEKNIKIKIAYANANSLNKIHSDKELKKMYESFDIIHPDGTGVYLASKFLNGDAGLKIRLTGSDFYTKLISESIKRKWSYFFFGHTTDILKEISKVHPDLIISGIQDGYNFEDQEVIEKINKTSPDIVIIGLSCPIQEKWMYEHQDKINFKVMITVGDGIKVFANKKIRGPDFMRKIGMEWLSRFISNPVNNFEKYIIGNPIFIIRVLKEKLKSGLIK